MRRRRAPLRPPGRTIPALFLAFVLGGIVGWWTHATISREPAAPSGPLAANPRPTDSVERESTPSPAPVIAPAQPTPTAGSVPIAAHDVAELRRHSLRLPIDEVRVASLEGNFAEPRRGEPHGHEAVDMLAPRNTPVRAVEDGTIAKLFLSKAGGITIYQFDPSKRFVYYYAHLDHYASGLHEGQVVAKGDVIGYVGTTGNAPANTPHLHFAIYRLDEAKRWWKGIPIDPYLVWKP